MFACSQGHQGIAKWLLAAGVDVKVSANFNKTVLMYAAWNGHSEIVKLLIAAGAHVNVIWNYGHNDIAGKYRAGTKEHHQCIEALFEAGADVNAHDHNGRHNGRERVPQLPPSITKYLLFGMPLDVTYWIMPPILVKATADFGHGSPDLVRRTLPPEALTGVFFCRESQKEVSAEDCKVIPASTIATVSQIFPHSWLAKSYMWGKIGICMSGEGRNMLMFLLEMKKKTWDGCVESERSRKLFTLVGQSFLPRKWALIELCCLLIGTTVCNWPENCFCCPTFFCWFDLGSIDCTPSETRFCMVPEILRTEHTNFHKQEGRFVEWVFEYILKPKDMFCTCGFVLGFS